MCGIYAVLCGRDLDAPPSLDRLISKIIKLVGHAPDTPPDQVRPCAEEVKNESGLWVRPEGFLALLADQAQQDRLSETVHLLEQWQQDLERHLAKADLTQVAKEGINQLLTLGRDTVWQIREDLLQNLPKTAALLPHLEDRTQPAFQSAWALNLILNNIDRLEVRGRDSAGIAAYVAFPSDDALCTFLDQAGRRNELASRSRRTDFSDCCVVIPDTAPNTLLFAFKVAEEVGEMGQNVRDLRRAITDDRLFQDALMAPGASMQAMGHTRWASNGVISLSNCHPVDSTLLDKESNPLPGWGALVASLNGDIDNYQELFKKYVDGQNRSVDPGITTDAKIIPIVVQAHLQETGNLEEAFARAFEEFEGSMAISLMAANQPGRLICAQKGSGQGLFVGIAGNTLAVASEMYGIVELTPHYIKAEGETEQDGRTVGETFLVRRPDQGGIALYPGNQALDPARITPAEITTRDINRGEFPRFLLKEISESVLSVEKTIRGKIRYNAAMEDAEILLDHTVLPPDLMTDLRAGRIKRIIPTGQGTAAVAAQGIAFLLEQNLKGSPIEVTPMKATELSSHFLQDDMSHCLVVAVSQSGTTTDTNRTVDLVKERGAFVIGIVNRRNSDLVYKSNGVLYTSDGRDIEMSVASTKAFYAQNVAGQILALALAHALQLLDQAALFAKVKDLLDLPAVMDKVLNLAPRVQEVAEKTALKRRYWAVVGTGASKIAADEIRIKLSELCYKAIAVDFLEDKKHIDLSSEPMILVIASGLPPASVSDVVKEVAIFKAHQSVPIVIHDEEEDRFNPYAAFRIPLPQYTGDLKYLLPTMVGHLYGFYGASAFDQMADQMRKLRTGLVREIAEHSEEMAGTELWQMLGRSVSLTSDALKVQSIMEKGDLDSGLEVGTATRLTSLLDFLLGRIPLNAFTPRFKKPGTVGNLLASLVEQLSLAVNEVCRPIDAIKHQAKTVTVGISRQADRVTGGVLWSLLKELEIPATAVTASHGNTMTALEPLIRKVEGTTLYQVEGLTPIGKPLYTSTIRVEKKLGAASNIASRSDQTVSLAGTKWGVVADDKLFLGRGHKDNRRILIVPLVGQKNTGRVLLYHLEFVEKGPREKRLAALRSLQDRYKQILISVTESLQREWDPSLIDRIDNEALFFADPRTFGRLLGEA